MAGPAEVERAMEPEDHGREQTGENCDVPPANEGHRPAGEDEAADVAVEVGILDPELATMEPEQVVLPARHLRDRNQDRDHGGGGEHHGAPRQAMGERSEQLGERGRAVAGAPEHDLHHARGACVADGGEPDRRNDHVAGGERNEARELRD
jgi:hypothetical protein